MNKLLQSRSQRVIKMREFILLGLAFIILFFSYSINLWKVVDEKYFISFDRQEEGLVIGRLARATQDGVFSYGGLAGLNYVRYSINDTTYTKAEEYALNLSSQHDIYLTNKELPDEFYAYKSQTGGQAIMFSALQKILPFSNITCLKIFRAINAFLTTLCFILFICWTYRNFGIVSASITFGLLFLSTWPTAYSHNLWWALWSFYIPFLTMLLLLERRSIKPDRYTPKKMYIGVFIAVFAKCFFTGFEFISSTLLAAICPVVYYSIIEKDSLKTFVISSVRYGMCMVLAVIAEMLILILQVRMFAGSFSAGINHIIISYTKRTTYSIIEQHETLGDILTKYLQGSIFDLGFFPPTEYKFHFGLMVLIGIICCIIIFFTCKKIHPNKYLQNKALIGTFLFSLLAPLSWFIIFKQHASEHPHLDYIVWYFPTLLFAYLVIGQGISILLTRKQK